MTNDPRLERILELIEQIFGDVTLSREKTRELLEAAQEDVESRLEALVGDDEDRSC
jgi:predicted component of type VI protein secretion system